MKIVVLDGYTENPGDLSWAGFEALGSLTVYDRTPFVEGNAEILRRARGAEAVIVNKTPLSAETIGALLPELRYIGVLATGFNVVDIAAAKAAGMLTLIISASNAFFVKPIAERVFGVDVALGTELVVRNGRITPELSGTPTFREGKVVRLCAALEHRGLRPAETVFYTDSRNDLPLALASGDCVAVNPDPVLLEAARENGWLVNAWKL